MEVDKILDKLSDIENRLVTVENGNIITNSDISSEPNVINNFVYDAYLVDYLNEANASNFAYKKTKVCYDEYVDYRRSITSDDELIASIRLFNKMVKARFPMLKINHINRKGNNIYVWDLIGEM